MSILPPRTRAKLDRLPRADRMEYAQTLKGSYEYRLNHITDSAKNIAEQWAWKQGEHLEKCIAELDEILT